MLDPISSVLTQWIQELISFLHARNLSTNISLTHTIIYTQSTWMIEENIQPLFSSTAYTPHLSSIIQDSLISLPFFFTFGQEHLNYRCCFSNTQDENNLFLSLFPSFFLPLSIYLSPTPFFFLASRWSPPQPNTPWSFCWFSHPPLRVFLP